MFCAFAFLLRCSSQPGKQDTELRAYASLSDTTRYVGIQACKECHLSIYNSFIETGMGQSFDRATKKKSSARFGNDQRVFDPSGNFYYHPSWKSDSLFVREYRLNKNDTVFKRDVQVNYIVGSGQHTNSHIMNTNGYLHQVPVTFYTQRAQWDMAPGFENGNNTRFSRMIGLECMSCHNAYPDFVMGSENKYTSVKNGIDCERCHGPGSVHVEQKRASVLVDVSKEIDYSIVNPAKLPVDLQFDICQRCHIQGNAVLRDEKSFFDFRPGMSLSSVMNVFMPVFSGRDHEHIMASHAERLKQSRCFLETRKREEAGDHARQKNDLFPYQNSITCVTCHNPHVSVRVTGKEVFNKACSGCHRSGKDPLCPESEARRLKAGNNCVSCHMPRSGATDIPHVTVTDHRIQVPYPERRKEEVKKFIGITCINNTLAPAEAIAKAYIAYFEKFNADLSMLDSAMVRLQREPAITGKKKFSMLVHILFLRNDYSGIVSLAGENHGVMDWLNKKDYVNADAWTCYRIGESYTNLKLPAKALSFYRRATDLAPFELDFQNKLGASLMENKDIAGAKKVFEFILQEDSGYYQACSNLGFIHLSLYGDTVTAGRFYDKSLGLNPDYENAWMNKAGLYLYMQQPEMAGNLLKMLLKKNPGNIRAREILSRIAKSS